MGVYIVIINPGNYNFCTRIHTRVVKASITRERIHVFTIGKKVLWTKLRRHLESTKKHLQQERFQVSWISNKNWLTRNSYGGYCFLKIDINFEKRKMDWQMFNESNYCWSPCLSIYLHCLHLTSNHQHSTMERKKNKKKKTLRGWGLLVLNKHSFTCQIPTKEHLSKIMFQLV